MTPTNKIETTKDLDVLWTRPYGLPTRLKATSRSFIPNLSVGSRKSSTEASRRVSTSNRIRREKQNISSVTTDRMEDQRYWQVCPQSHRVSKNEVHHDNLQAFTTNWDHTFVVMRKGATRSDPGYFIFSTAGEIREADVSRLVVLQGYCSKRRTSKKKGWTRWWCGISNRKCVRDTSRPVKDKTRQRHPWCLRWRVKGNENMREKCDAAFSGRRVTLDTWWIVQFLAHP